MDPSSLSINKLVGLLRAHEARLNSRVDIQIQLKKKNSNPSSNYSKKNKEHKENKNDGEYSRSTNSINSFENKKDKYLSCGICNQSCKIRLLASWKSNISLLQ